MPVGKWESCFWISTFPSGLVVGAVGMCESPAFGDFQGLVGAEGNLPLVFLRVHSPAFPPLSSCAPLLHETAEQLAFNGLHLQRRRRVAFAPGPLLQLGDREIAP